MNQQKDLEFPDGWSDSENSGLWNYNLHYFEDLNANESESRLEWHVDLLNSWLDHNPVGSSPAWDSYPTSLRIVNWVKWAINHKDEFTDLMRANLAQQGRWLSQKLDYHLLANHLWANAKALVFAGCYFQGKESDAWLEKGVRILLQQCDEQLLKDGGHFELSTMYHSIVLEDCLDLLQLDQVYPRLIPKPLIEEVSFRVGAALDWLVAMSHSREEFAFFNDSALGTAPTLVKLEDYAKAIGVRVSDSAGDGITWLSESGYIRLTQEPVSIICDVGHIGPDYQPGHAHADTLSFEMSVLGSKLIANSGISTYEPGVEREFQRSTRAHNTVEVDGENSSEVWKSFRVARRAHTYDLEVDEAADTITITCSHDGYERLPGKVTHRRLWELTRNQLSITDRLIGSFNTASARYYLHPDASMEIETENRYKLLIGDTFLLFEVIAGKAFIEDAEYYPEFGVTQASKCLRIEFTSDTVESVISWH
ncbi:MAG: alginate lyase family protein [Gammaproteobacteria bacterium]